MPDGPFTENTKHLYLRGMLRLATIIILLLPKCAISAGLKDDNANNSADFTQNGSTPTEVELCQERNETAWTSFMSYSKANLKETSFEITNIYQTIDNFGPTTVYVPCDGMPRLKFLGPPTSSQTRNVTQIHTVTKLYLPMEEEEEKKAWREVPCTSSELQSPGDDIDLATQFNGPDICDRATLSYFEELAHRQASPTAAKQSLPAGRCAVFGNCELELSKEITLFYWAPEPRKGDICASPNSESRIDWLDLKKLHFRTIDYFRN
jgi:hypothetical protein